MNKQSVTIGLLDQNNRPVTEPDALKEGANELYNRVNKMGVSEVEIRVEGDHILLNFPGAQGPSVSHPAPGIVGPCASAVSAVEYAGSRDGPKTLLTEQWHTCLSGKRVESDRDHLADQTNSMAHTGGHSRIRPQTLSILTRCHQD